MKENAQRPDPPAASDRVYFFVHWLVNRLVRLFTRFEAVGAENMPRDGAYLVTANHHSFFDAPIVFMMTPIRMRCFGADKWRSTPLLGRFMELIGVIWVTRGEADRDALRAALNLLKSGGRLGVAPEGTRSRTGGLQRGKPGAAYLADRAQVLVVPMAFTGTESVLGSWRRFKRPRVRCVIGEPYRLPSDGRAKGARLDELSDLIMVRLADLLPPAYRGVYIDHPLLRSAGAPPSGAGSAASAERVPEDGGLAPG